MQIKIFTIPIHGGELLTDDLNVFLRSKKILQVEQQLLPQEGSACWCFSIKYLDDLTMTERERAKVDYKQMLDEASFQRFSKMREIRREIAQEEAIPAYAVFSDGELAGMAKIEDLTTASMKSVKGIGEKKVEKYGHRFLPKASTPEA